MKVLWIVGGINLFPEAVMLLNGENSEVKSTGGWITASANMLASHKDIYLGVSMVSDKVSEVVTLQGERTVYYIIPNERIEDKWRKIVTDFCPDVIHIHGTENYNNIIKFIDACGAKHVVLSIQGVVPAIERYCHAGISYRDAIKNITFADVYLKDLLVSNKRIKEISTASKYIFSKVHHIIGRTICDRAYTWAINASAQYYFCNETLREAFYTGCWTYDNCDPHTIFLSQANRPLKGLHLLLEALPLVRRQYPDVKVRIAGLNFIKHNNLHERLRLTGYGKLINNELLRKEMLDVVDFLGELNAEGMKKEYLRANLFVNPSTIENSPNSLCEAQILGVPCLSSYVGGVPDMIPNASCGEMYRFDEPEVLAYKICELFESSKTFDNTIMRQTAHERHNPNTNVEVLKNIYSEIIKNS